jgi:hypothetical protein
LTDKLFSVEVKMFAYRKTLEAVLGAAILVSMLAPGLGFSSLGNPARMVQKLQGEICEQKERIDVSGMLRTSAAAVLATVILGTSPVYADELGRETEAPTMFTGETTMVRSI